MPDLKVISVGVHDMPAARKFYEEALRFEVDDDSMLPHFLQLTLDGPILLLTLCERRHQTGYPAEATITLNLKVDDAAAEFKRLRELGAALLHDQPQPSPVGPYFGVQDPSGNVIELVQFS